ncbi:MAG: UMP kinase [Patescibacteria group bacterium]
MYNRIMLKLSGELMMGNKDFGIDQKTVSKYASQIVELVKMGKQVIVEIGAGNIYRGREEKEMKRTIADNLGMLGSVMNAINLREAIDKFGHQEARALSQIYMPFIIQYYTPGKAIHYMDEKKIVIMGGGTGNQFFSTDTGAVLHGLQTGCDVVLKATNVDGVYNSDPNENKDAKKYDTLSYDEVLSKKLAVMDQTAFALARDNGLTIVVFNVTKEGNLKKAAMGEKIGTIVK